MTRFTKTKKALRALTDTILGGSSNVVRTLKVAGHMNENSGISPLQRKVLTH